MVGATLCLGNKAAGARVAEPAGQAQPRFAKQLRNRFTCGARLHLMLQVLDLGCHPGAWLQASGGWQCSPLNCAAAIGVGCAAALSPGALPLLRAACCAAVVRRDGCLPIWGMAACPCTIKSRVLLLAPCRWPASR